MSPPVTSILVRGVNWLGDAVMTLPALHRLREAFPAAQIHLLCPAKLADLWHRHPAIDHVTVFQAREGVWTVGRRLRSHPYDLALVLPNSPRSALETWLAGARQRVGYARPWRNWLLTRPVPPYPAEVPMRKRSPAEIQRLLRAGDGGRPVGIPARAHHLFHYLHLTAVLGANPSPLAPQLFVGDEEATDFAARFGLPTDDATPWIGLNPGAEYGPAKRWPLDRFVAAATRVHQDRPCRWLLLGGRSDIPLAAELERELSTRCLATSPSTGTVRVVNLAGKTTLRELCVGLRLCRVVLTNDTGPMHVAAAVGTPVVVPFGSTSPELTGPGLPGDARHALLAGAAPCAPCFLRECPADFRCLRGLEVDAVVQAVLERIERPVDPA